VDAPLTVVVGAGTVDVDVTNVVVVAAGSVDVVPGTVVVGETDVVDVVASTVVLGVPKTVVVVPPGSDVVGGKLVVVLSVRLVVVAEPQAQSRVAPATPTATRRHASPSIALTAALPFTSQMQEGAQVSLPTAALRTKRQSLALGFAPCVLGCAQSP
jgi:hypothetical protein